MIYKCLIYFKSEVQKMRIIIIVSIGPRNLILKIYAVCDKNDISHPIYYTHVKNYDNNTT